LIGEVVSTALRIKTCVLVEREVKSSPEKKFLVEAPDSQIKHFGSFIEVVIAMKADIHPQYHEITVIMSDGSEFKTRSTYGEEGSSLRLDIDPKVHPAWTGGNTHLVDTGGRVGRFNKRFGNFGLKK